jgi:hypothetical protein
MRTIVLGLAVITAVASAQDRDRTFFLTHTSTVQQFQEVATAIRTIADIKQISTENDQKRVTVRASAPQIAMAEWLFNELDNPAVQPSVLHEYRVPGTVDDVVRVFYITGAPTTQDFQEIATLVRTISNITRVFTYNAPKALVVRDTAAQIQLAEWLVKELEQPAPSSTHEFRVQGSNADLVSVMFLPHTASVEAFQKSAVQIRTATQITRMFTCNGPRALAARGTPDQIAMAQRMAKQLDKP